MQVNLQVKTLFKVILLGGGDDMVKENYFDSTDEDYVDAMGDPYYTFVPASMANPLHLYEGK